jgi:YjbE family integral membrane protein
MEISPEFWQGLLKIIFVNILLSGDNAVVIALASRTLPVSLRSRAIWFGALGAVVLRLIFSLFILQLMAVPYLKLIGALLLLWIGVKMLVPEHSHEGDEDNAAAKGSGSIWNAVKTIIIADAVMSLDNVIAIAAAAGGNFLLILIGLAMSVPLIIYGSTLILHFLIRYPILVMAGAGLIGWIAGEIWITDPAVAPWTHEFLENHGHWLEWASAAVGAALVVVVGKLIAMRTEARRRDESVVDLAAGKIK